MPSITSQFLSSAMRDRPLVPPRHTTNLASVEQYCEKPDDAVSTVGHSVRSANTAVYALLDGGKSVSPFLKEEHDLTHPVQLTERHNDVTQQRTASPVRSFVFRSPGHGTGIRSLLERAGKTGRCCQENYLQKDRCSPDIPCSRPYVTLIKQRPAAVA
jgi:myosin-crossreactive antigen